MISPTSVSAWLVWWLLTERPTRGRVLRASAVAALAFGGVSFISGIHAIPDVGTRERLGVLWQPLVQHSDLGVQFIEEHHPEFVADFEAFMLARKFPPRTRLEPAWYVEQSAYFARDGRSRQPFMHLERGSRQPAWRWWKAPPWVLMSQRGMSYAEALGWQFEASVEILREHWKDYLFRVVSYQIPRVVGNMFPTSGEPVSDYTVLGHETPLAPGVQAVLLGWIEIANRGVKVPILMCVTLLCGLWGVVATRRLDLALVLLVPLLYVTIAVALAGDHVRYNLPLHTLAGVYLFLPWTTVRDAKPRRARTGEDSPVD